MGNKVVANVLLLALMAVAPMAPMAQAAGEAYGVLQWEQKAALSVPVSGVVEAINVVQGQRVAKGAVLLSLDKRPFQYRLQSARSRMAQFAPGRDEARNELQRAEELYERTVLSQVELDQAKIDFAEKDARYQEAGADVDQAELDLEYAELKAPFDLIVLKSHVVVGQTVINRLQATPLVTVAAGKLVAVISLSPENIAALNIGSDLQVSIAGQVHTGKVNVIDYDAKSGSAEVAILIDDQPAATAGQRVHVTWQ